MQVTNMATSLDPERRVRFHDDSEEVDSALPMDVHGVCQMCLKQSARYTCPRCNIPYCSSSCYKDSKHSDCSESFYKENCMQALRESDVGRGDKEMMKEMLQRLEESNPADSDDDDDEYSCEEESLTERLRGVDLDADPEQIWQRLSEAERAEFADIIKSENLDLLVPPWVPWWTIHDQELIRVVEDLESCDAPPDETKAVPKAIEDIPKLSEILRNKEPSPLIINDIINVIYTYTLLMRFHNGEVADFTVELAQNFLQVSEALAKNRNYGSLEESVHSVIENITKVMKEASSYRLMCLQDITHILLGRCPSQPLEYVISALSDCWRIVASAKKSLSKDSSQKSLQKQLFACKKKLEFHLSWAMSFPESFRVVAVEVQCLYKSLSENQKLEEGLKSGIVRKTGEASKELIKEIT